MFGHSVDISLTINSPWPQFIVQGEPRVTQDRYGRILRVYLPITHTELGNFKEISGNDAYTLQEKLNELLVSWDKKYQTQLEKREIQNGKQLAEELVQASEEQIHQISSILKDTLNIDDAVDWETLKVESNHREADFEKPIPTKPNLSYGPVLRLPDFHYPEFKYPEYVEPKVPLKVSIFGKRGSFLENNYREWQLEKDKAQSAHSEKRAEAKVAYEKELENLEQAHSLAVKAHEEECERLMKAHERRIQRWTAEKEEWKANQERIKTQESDRVLTHNLGIDALKKGWQSGIPEAVVEHAYLVLDNSNYPEWFEGSYRFAYERTSRLGQVEFLLPSPEIVNLPKSARFIASTGEIRTTSLAKADQRRLFDELCYQVAIRTVHELFEADTAMNLESILFNGVVRQINPATGLEEQITIMSGIFEREKFLELNLEYVDPKACFKSFKGVSASSLIGLAPVSPIMELSREDHRFINEKSVGHQVSAELNLAAMDWEDFEHLVREIFGKEFGLRGGEVKITQSSSDGGVDAIAFDPDPITGGKIVIQAKRYTRTVGVSAVRDLYGTVMNEGAGRGILVTTADYGPDAYKFAADKPLTLLNGANLLFILEKHGMNANIDIPAARKELGLGR